MQKGEKKRLFYGWIIAISCAMVMGGGTGLFSNSTGIFVVPVTEALGISRGAFTLHSTIMSVSGLFMIYYMGRLLRSKPYMLKRMLMLSAVICSVSFFCYSFSTEVWHFYIFAGILGFFWPALGGITLTTLINNWFVDKKGLAMGIAFSGSGLTAAVMTPITTAVVADHGWQMGYRLLAICSATLFAVAIILIRLNPSDKGLVPLGSGEELGGSAPVKTGISSKQAMRSPALYFTVIGIGCGSFICMAISSHAIAYLTELGYSSITAASVMSLVMTVMIGAKILLGAAFDKIGTFRSAILVGFCVLSSITALRFAALSPFMPWIFALCFGFGFSTLTVPLPYFVANNFGTREYVSIYSFCSIFMFIPGSISQPLAGFIRDNTGSYYTMWNLGIAVSVLGLTLLALAAVISSKKGYATYLPDEERSEVV